VVVVGERVPDYARDGAATAPLRCGAHRTGLAWRVSPQAASPFLGSNRPNAPFGYTSRRLDQRSHPERPEAPMEGAGFVSCGSGVVGCLRVVEVVEQVPDAGASGHRSAHSGLTGRGGLI
jgi:hypothetical protein